MNKSFGPYFNGINVNDPADYDKIIKRIKEYDDLIAESKDSAEKAVLRMEKEDIIDAAKRMTCHISSCTEDNFVS